MNYLLSPTTTMIHDIYLRYLRKNTERTAVSEKRIVLFQKALIIIVGILAYIMATRMASVLESAYFAYTIYGVAISPALIAALASKRVTRIAGLISIISGTVITVFLKLAGYIWPAIMRPVGDPNGDPFGISLIYPAIIVSILSLVVISLFTKPPSQEVLARFFPDTKEEK